VHVGLVPVFGLFLLLAVIVAMRQRVVVVLVGVPVPAVFLLVQRIVRVVMRHVVVIVRVDTSRVCVSGLFPLALSSLDCSRCLHDCNLP